MDISRKRSMSAEPITPSNKRRKEFSTLSTKGSPSNPIVLDDEIIPREKSPIIDLDTVGEVDVIVEETNSGGEDEITEIPVTDLGNGGARPDFSREKMIQKIQKFKKEHKKEYEEMTQEIIHHYEANIQRGETIMWKKGAKNKLEQAIRIVYPQAKLYCVGSTMNGCGSYNSDMDICAIIPELHDGTKGTRGNKVIQALQKMKRHVHRMPEVRKVIVINAVVPILQVEFMGIYEGLDVDLNINNYAGIRNTHLIHHYSKMDERFPMICLLIKHWAIVQVLHYMQCVCQPAILPNLLQVCAEYCNTTTSMDKLVWNKKLVEELPQTDNRDEITALLLGFFDYYSNFDWDKYAISIREAKVFLKSNLSHEKQNYSIFIEEPYDYRNTARCVHGKGFDRIKMAFKKALDDLTTTKHPSLQKLGIQVHKNFPNDD